MKKLFLITAIAGFLLSCHNNKKASEPIIPVAITDTAAVRFFPITSFIKGQLLQFDSLTITPLHIITMHEKADSQWIKREQLKTFLQPFLTPEITETNLTKYFKETKFNDQTINAITFTYEPLKALPDSINILNWNVYVSPERSTVTKVYMVKRINQNGQKTIQQLTWKTDSYAQITTILIKPDGSSELIKDDKFVWNFNP